MIGSGNWRRTGRQLALQPEIRYGDKRRQWHPRFVEYMKTIVAQITMDTYTHAIPAMQEEATRQLAAQLVASSQIGEAR